MVTTVLSQSAVREWVLGVNCGWVMRVSFIEESFHPSMTSYIILLIPFETAHVYND